MDDFFDPRMISLIEGEWTKRLRTLVPSRRLPPFATVREELYAEVEALLSPRSKRPS